MVSERRLSERHPRMGGRTNAWSIAGKVQRQEVVTHRECHVLALAEANRPMVQGVCEKKVRERLLRVFVDRRFEQLLRLLDSLRELLVRLDRA